MRAIKSVSEAFSMQPKTWSITSREDYEKWSTNGWSTPDYIEGLIEKISWGTKRINGDPFDVLYAFNFSGEVIHEFVPLTVNIHYL